MLKKLRIKFICILMVIVTIIFCTAFGLVIHSTKRNLEQDSLRLLYEIARPDRPFDPYDMKQSEPRLPHFVIQQSITGKVTVYGAGFYDLDDADFIEDVLSQTSASEQETGILREYNLRYLHITTPNGVTVSCVDISSEQSTIQSLVKTCTILGVVVLGIFFIISIILARWAVKPVELAWNQQKQFVADASHELKTPLTVILTNAELLQNSSFSDEEKGNFSASILTMSRQMRGLVEALLNLARMDNAAVNPAFSPVNLSRLITNTVLPFDALFFEQNMSFTNAVEDEIMVNGNEGQLRQVLEIFLDNALKYASAQANVTVSLIQHGHNCVLTVANNGPAISPSDLKQIFKRFYRVDPVRQMNRSYGLGLSIAESIIISHHGKIWAESSAGINSFHVQLPTL